VPFEKNELFNDDINQECDKAHDDAYDAKN